MKITTIAPGRWLDAPAAASYARMRLEGLGAGINSAGRTPEEQAELFLTNYERRAWNPLRPSWSRGPYGDVRWWKLHRYVRVTAVQAAPPGASYSYHEKGNALDLPAAERAWMRVNGARHGWFATVPGEPWHWEYIASRDRYRDTAPPTPTPPPPTPPEEDDMNYTEMLRAAYIQHLKRPPSDAELAPRLLRIAALTTQAEREERLRAEITAIATSPEAQQK